VPVKVVGGTVNQKFIGPLTLGLGGKYVSKQDTLQTYMGLGNVRLDLKRLGNFWVHHEYIVKGIEVGEHPQKTVITYIPLAIFNQVAKANAEFTYQLMMFFAEELRQSEEKNIPALSVIRVKQGY